MSDGFSYPYLLLGDRAFRDVRLVYPGGGRALAGINLEAAVGQIVAIAGSTGAGKTSLASLIPRYRSPGRAKC